MRKNETENMNRISYIIKAASKQFSKDTIALITFLDKIIKEDFTTFIHIIEDNSNDAINTNNIMKLFSEYTTELIDNIHLMGTEINRLVDSMSESNQQIEKIHYSNLQLENSNA